MKGSLAPPPWLTVGMRLAALLVGISLFSCRSKQVQQTAIIDPLPLTAPDLVVKPVVESDVIRRRTPTAIVVHNVIFYEASGLKLKVRWLRGRMYATKLGVNPSFDHPDSFYIKTEEGSMSADLTNFSSVLNSYVFKNSPLREVKLTGIGQQVKVSGILHKAIPLPVKMSGELDASSDGRIHIRVNKIAVLKIPLKGLFSGLHIKTSDLFDPKGVDGIEVKGDDIYIDPSKVMPPPHNLGRLTRVTISKDHELLETYGVPHPDIVRVKEWRNFISIKGGAIDFGRLTMHNADMVIIDTSQDDWFRFDLARYQEQLVNGYARITPNAGLQMFMTDISKVRNTKANRDISLQWLKDRNVAPPADVPKQ